MNFIEFCNQKLSLLSRELEEIENRISKFPKADELSIEKYGTKKELSRQIKKEKGHKISMIFFKNNINEIKRYIHQKEIESLQLQQKKLKKAIMQLKNLIVSYNPLTNTFNTPIFPNDIIIKTILEFAEKRIEEYDVVLERLVNLFKQTDPNETSLLSKIERDIGEQFDSNLNIVEGVSTETLSFTLEKLLKVAIGSDYNNQFEMSINALNIELKVREKASGSKEKRNELLVTQNAIKELKEYISGDKIIKAAISLEYFESLLIKAGINKLVRQQYLAQMKNFLKLKEKEEGEKLLKKYLNEDELNLWRKSVDTIDQTNSQALKDLLERLSKDIISICKYMDMVGSPEELTESYEAIAQKLDTIKYAIKHIKEETSEEHVFSYTTNSNNIPSILINIETTDQMQYEEIFESLKTIASERQKGTTIQREGNIEFKVLHSACISLVYALYKDDIIVISAIPSQLARNKNIDITEATINRVEKVISEKEDPDFAKKQATYEDLILQSLDLRTINSNDYHHSLKKEYKDKS